MTINRAFLSGINSVFQLIFLSIYTSHTTNRDSIFGVLCSDFFVRFALAERRDFVLLNTIVNSADISLLINTLCVSYAGLGQPGAGSGSDTGK